MSHHYDYDYVWTTTCFCLRILFASWILYSTSSTFSSSLLGGIFLIPQRRKFRLSNAVLTGMVMAFCTATYMMMPVLNIIRMSTAATTSSSSSSSSNTTAATAAAVVAAFASFASTTTTIDDNHSIHSSNSNDNHHAIELAHMAIFPLSIIAAFVGAALGSLAPRVASGATLGYGVALWVCALVVMICYAAAGTTTTTTTRQEEDEGGLSSQEMAEETQNQQRHHHQQRINDYEYGYGYDNYTASCMVAWQIVAALLGGILTAWYYNPIILTLSTVVIFGSFIFSIAIPNAFHFLQHMALGQYQYYHTSYSSSANNDGSDDYDSIGDHFLFLSLAWLFSCVVTAAVIVYRDCRGGGGAERSYYYGAQTDDVGINNCDDGTLKPIVDTTPRPFYSAPPLLANTNAYNMFDPADLPPRLNEYANMVYSVCNNLGYFFGFQDSSVRNQAEHLLILISNNRRNMNSHIILPPALQPSSPIRALHDKVFSNYMKWCHYLGVRPHFAGIASVVPSVRKTGMAEQQEQPISSSDTTLVVDLVLFFCIWGEAGNIRHMPECVWFLYHKMMEEYSNSMLQDPPPLSPRSLYAGHFLDYVVTPIYNIVSTSMQSDADHINKRNYDDFNEFFWSTNCLLCHYSCDDPSELRLDVEDPNDRVTAPLLVSSQVPIAVGMMNAPKTFLEKRSWLRGIMAFNRIIDWHIVTFYLLSVLAFSCDLVWGWVYTLQAASGVFWILNSLAIFWELLEVWASYPGIHLGGDAIFGSVFVLVARFIVLTNQTLYLIWTFSLESDSTFWWWQFVWLSLPCMIPYVLQTMVNFLPAVSTTILTSRNEYVQSFLNIHFPISRLYIGKEVHESFKHAAIYTFFWATLIAWKLYFSFVYEIHTMVLPTIEITDYYATIYDKSFRKTSLLLLLFLRWMPQFLVYCIDMTIWFAVWQAFAGLCVGFSDHLGDIRSMKDIRNNLGRAPEHFCAKILSIDAGSRRGSSDSILNSAEHNSMECRRQCLMYPNSNDGETWLRSDHHKLQGYVDRLLEVRIQKWVMFSTVWNEVIDHFREEDLISNRERDYLKFSRFDGFSQAIYLPVFQTAGVVEKVLALLELRANANDVTNDDNLFKPILNNVTMRTAVTEVWELGNYFVLKIVGPVHNDDIVYVVNSILKWVESGTVTNHMHITRIRGVINNLIQLVGVLGSGILGRKPSLQRRFTGKCNTAPSSGRCSGMRRAVSASSLITNSVQSNSKQPQQSSRADMDVEVADALLDNTRDMLRSLINSLKDIMIIACKESNDVRNRLTFVLSMENGFFWDDDYASDRLDDLARSEMFKSILTKLHGVVACHPNEVEPKSEEARRRLTFFVNSLFMDIPNAPSIRDMFSWNVLTPYYKESVTLSKSELEARSDALGVSTMLYLQTLFKADWANFLERIGLNDEDKVWTEVYAKETRQWASIRAQTLNRTVSGMMYFEKALRLLARLEQLDEDTTNDLMGEKFGYVVACQEYSQMKRDQDSKADDIDDLMHRFSHMRVAYIDCGVRNRTGKKAFYSCLGKSDGNGMIKELYRIRLPGNPILGEGKPENQNHAIIFTRGEFVQTIDMNQEGYFEEALKMRNALQEFAKQDGPMPTTILGLREHTFTGGVSSLANYMALQETSFATLGQRVLTKPLCIRLHYGHPDVFDKLFFITRGGICKSSKGINLSEDIFAGYNNTIRGGQVAFKEYVQVGKGRDVGMSQIYQFEAKLSQGAGEQSLSRDVYRLNHRLDFSRLLSNYYGGIGHYFSNVLTIMTVYTVVYLMAILALYDLERIGDKLIIPRGTLQMLLGGLGLLQTIPLFAMLGVERGWWVGCRELIHVFVTGGPLHFMFHIQTKAFYMTQTILVGGAKYRPTGRGFVTQHTPMDELYRFFASSHFYLGVEMGAGLIVMGIYSEAKQYFGRTWSLWLASLSFIASPFWFNPLTFDWNTVSADYVKFIAWMCGSSGGAARSWSIWWLEENSFYSKMPLGSKCSFIIKAALQMLCAGGIARSDLLKFDPLLNKPVVGVPLVVASIVILFFLCWLLSMVDHMMPYPVRRSISMIVGVGLMVSCITVLIEDSDFIRFGLAAYYGTGALCQIGLLFGIKFVKNFYFIHDIVCGHVIFIPLFILAILRIPHHIQSWLLYHNALSSDVVVSNILRYARKSQESSGSTVPDDDSQLMKQMIEFRRCRSRSADITSGSDTDGEFEVKSKLHEGGDEQDGARGQV